ncbi:MULTISPECIES: type III PLP-dependent enzyme [Dickeya]|uniref:Achromobactin biosynthesis protein AcsE, Orn/DAP/Arg decarboxylase family n=1 Tax=Dickeya aquatica TaxID=1401087 RepID=A0A375A8P8_9GAMM|nr:MULTISPECIES: type III PLP-dependent enzyme [Dickeya]SLM62482.1 Achromobactin biosynthesis protein AcsE, Orn/DAP/Arg decarboxylase family [Dickeya aquatica]
MANLSLQQKPETGDSHSLTDGVHPLPAHIRAAVIRLQQQQTDPLAAFVYDLNALRQHVSRVMAALPDGVELYYAIKANSEKPILDALAPLVHGFEISSGGEIARVLGCDTRKPFVFSGPGKLDSDFAQALAHGAQAIHVESRREIARLQQCASARGVVQSVLIRINPTLPDTLTSKLAMAGTPTPFGIDESELAEAVREVDNASHLQLTGFHVHAMSHQMDVWRHQQLLAFYLTRWPHWKALSARPETVRHLNVGGGIGVAYLTPTRFDWQALCDDLQSRLAQLRDAPLLRFEPGRFISAYCGYYAIEVLDKKHSHGKDFLVCRGGTHQFRLPVAQGHDHPVILVPRHRAAVDDRQASAVQTWTVVGQLCTPKDVLSRDQRLGDVAVGDILVLPLAGAYGYNISHADFLCHPRPVQGFIDTDAVIRDASGALLCD